MPTPRPIAPLLAAASIAALLLAVPAEADAARIARADLDRDGRLERVQVVRRGSLQHLQVMDRIRGRLVRRTISPRVQSVRFRIKDYNADRIPDIWFNGGSATVGAAPRYFGLYNWTGRRRRTLWSYSSRRTSLGRLWAGAGANSVHDSSLYPGRELALTEGVLREGDPPWAGPSRLRITLYGYSRARRRYVRYDRLWATPQRVRGASVRPGA